MSNLRCTLVHTNYKKNNYTKLYVNTVLTTTRYERRVTNLNKLQLTTALLLYALGLVLIDYSNRKNKKLLHKYYTYTTLYVVLVYNLVLYLTKVAP